MNPEDEFRQLVTDISVNSQALDLFWRKKAKFDGYNFADAYVAESTDGRTFEKEVKVIGNNMRTQNPPWTKERARNAWMSILGSDDPSLFAFNASWNLDFWIRKSLLEFLRRYYTGWRDGGKPAAATTISPPPAKSAPRRQQSAKPAATPSATPKRQSAKPTPARSQGSTTIFSAGQGPRRETVVIPDEEYQAPEPNFTLPRRGGVFQTFEKMDELSRDENNKLWLIQYQSVFPTFASIKALGEAQRNSCYGASWKLVYTVPPDAMIVQGDKNIKIVQFVKQDRSAFKDYRDLIVKTVPIKTWGTGGDIENMTDVVIGSRLNLFLEAKLVRGFVRLVDWFVCSGRFVKPGEKGGEDKSESNRVLQTIQEKADRKLVDACSGVSKSASLTVTLLANLLLTLEAGQDLFEYVHNDLHTGNAFVSQVPPEEAGSVLRFDRPYGYSPLYLDTRLTNGEEVKIIDYGRNRIRVSYVFSDSVADKLIGPREGLENFGILPEFNPQYDMRLFALTFASSIQAKLQKGVVIAKDDDFASQDQIFGLLDEMAGSRYVRTTREEFGVPVSSLRPDEKHTFNEGDLNFETWANCVYNWTSYAKDKKDRLEKAKAANFGKTKTTLDQAEKAVFSILRDFQQKGMRYLIEASAGERKARIVPNELGYLPTVWTLICFWGWTPYVWNGHTPSTLLNDPRFFASLRERPEGRDIVKAVDYRSLTQFKESPSPSIGGGSSSWWHKLWNRSTPSAELEDFPEFYRVFEVQGVLGQGSEGLVIEVVDQQAPHTRRVLKLLPSLSLGDEQRSHVILQEAKIHMLVDQLCPAAPEYYGLFRVPIGPLIKQFPNFPAWLNVWDPSGRLAREQSMIGILMESIDGITLRNFIGSLFRNNQNLNEDGLSLLLLQLALQVKCLHDANIVHRDLSLANVMLDEANGRQARIIDFGLATAADNPLPPTKEGRWDYVAPESRSVQRYGTRWRRSSGDLTKLDIYSLGMILLKTGNRAVFEQESLSLEEAPFEPLEFYTMDNLIPGSNYLSRLCYLMLSEDPASRPSIDTVIQLIQMAKPDLAPVSSDFERLWKLTKEYAERVWRSVISGKSKQLKQHRHRSPIRPSQLSAK